MDITGEELKRRLDAGEKLHIVDVREEWEYEEQNIGAINIPLATLPNHLEQLSSFKDLELIVHCRSGGRSDQAKKYLMQQGFTNVRNLLGGMIKYPF